MRIDNATVVQQVQHFFAKIQVHTGIGPQIIILCIMAADPDLFIYQLRKTMFLLAGDVGIEQEIRGMFRIDLFECRTHLLFGIQDLEIEGGFQRCVIPGLTSLVVVRKGRLAWHQERGQGRKCQGPPPWKPQG